MEIEHVLSLPRHAEVPDPTFPHGWAFRLCDTYRLRALVEIFAKLRGSVLDFGCGVKPYEKKLRHSGVVEWLGVDHPVRTSGDDHLNLADVFLDEGKIPYPDNRFDIVISTQVLEHVRDLTLTLAELSRVLRPGGTLVVTCPMTAPLHELPNDFWRFTPYGLECLAAEKGFRLERTIALGGPITTILTLIAAHSNPVARIPLVGRFIQIALADFVTHSGFALEALAYRAGIRQLNITCDFLFVFSLEKTRSVG